MFTWRFDGEVAEQVDELGRLTTVELKSRPEGPHERHQLLLLLRRRVAADRVKESVRVPPDGRDVAVEQEAEDETTDQLPFHIGVELDDEAAANAAVGAVAF